MNASLLRRVGLIATALSLAACVSQTGITTNASGRGGELRERSTSSDPTDADRRAKVRLELASAYFGRGQLDTALDEVKRSIAAKADNPDAFSLRGLIYAALGEDSLAEDSFRRALEIDPRSADAMHNYGWFLCQRQRFADAAAQFQQALSQPQYREPARTYLARGVCLGRNGQWLEAEGSLMRAYELEPGNANTAVSLSEVLYKREDFERARFYISRVNNQPTASNAQTLWLAARIERKLGDQRGVREFGDQLRARFPQAPETALLDRGRFDD